MYNIVCGIEKSNICSEFFLCDFYKNKKIFKRICALLLVLLTPENGSAQPVCEKHVMRSRM